MCPLSKKFKNRFLQASENGISYDFVFIVGSEKIPVKVHKFMFAVASEVFQQMFYGELKEDHTVPVEDLGADGFKSMKHFIYTGEVNFTSALHALSTYIAARKYLLFALTKKCIKYIENNIIPSEVLEFFEYCEMNHIPDFEDLCFKTIEEKTDEVINSEYFSSAKIETIQLILKSRSLKLKSEIEVFDFFEKWALAEAARKKIGEEELASSFQNLKKYIRFSTITLEEFSSRIEQSMLLTKAEKRAIEYLLELDSTPENLPLVQQQRNFLSTLTSIEKYVKSHALIVTLGKICKNCSQVEDGNYCDNLIDIYYDIRVQKTNTQYLCFKIRLDKIYGHKDQDFYKMQSKVSLLVAKGVNECGDLTFLNECKFLFDPQLDGQSEVMFAEIPLKDLNEHFFIRGLEKTLIIQVQLNIIKINE